MNNNNNQIKTQFKLLHSEKLNDLCISGTCFKKNNLTVEIDEQKKLIVFARNANYIMNEDLHAFKICFEMGFNFLYENPDYAWCNELTHLQIIELKPLLFLHDTVNNFFIGNLAQTTNCYFVMPKNQLAEAGVRIYLNFQKPEKTDFFCVSNYQEI